MLCGVQTCPPQMNEVLDPGGQVALLLDLLHFTVEVKDQDVLQLH